jgi:epoxyqueuosine reductase QueG
MKKDKIDLAPTIDAGGEVQRVYYSLGHAINEMAHLLREKYGIKCQTSHPLGGLVNTPPLAGKAGMGWQGLDELLITPEYGKRNRIAPIFIEEKLFEFTDNHDHQWIELYCPSCRLCQKNCPTGAILTEKIPSTALVEGIKVQTSIDRIKCFPQFTKTLGCSICIKSCPFSGGPKAYERIKRNFDRNHKQLMKT